MKLSNLLIVSSAFSLAVAGSVVNHVNQNSAILYIVANVGSRCLVFPETMEGNCALLNTGPQCSVWYEEGETADVLPAYVTPLALPLCSIPLNSRY